MSKEMDALARELLSKEYAKRCGQVAAEGVLNGPWPAREDAAIRAIVAALSQQPSAVETITVQEAWEASGGNPGIKATKQELLEALMVLDEVCDDADNAEVGP